MTTPGDALLPPVAPGWPPVLLAGGAATVAPERTTAALARLRAETLHWPAPRARARRGRAVAFDADGLRAARALFDDAVILQAADPAEVDPDGLEAAFGGPPALRAWCVLGGLAGETADAQALLAAAEGRCPWERRTLSLEAALDAQALLRRAAIRARGPVGLYGMSPWKRRCLRPFLTGPDGPPVALRSPAAAAAHDGPVAVWGDADPPGRVVDLRVEDGFLRSVGLGLRHTPPLSLAISDGPPHFDATRPNSFEALVAQMRVDPAMLLRARRLRERIAALGLTKYNLAGTPTPLPDPAGRMAVLAPGQVENDASIRLGAGAVRTNLALLEATRAAYPDAFIAFKPHPDVIEGRRPGHVPSAAALRLADCIVERAPAVACLDWADRVATITSLTGFEALLRGKAVACFGRPFYAGWGLTDDMGAPPRGRRLQLDELVAATLLLYPAYVDSRTGLPAPPEIVVERLMEQVQGRRAPAARLRALWRLMVSKTLNALG